MTMIRPLTDTQRAILRDAAAHPHGLAAPPPNLPPAPRVAVARALHGAGLLARVDGAEGPHLGLAWRLDGERVLLRITEAGLRTIGGGPKTTSPEPQRSSVAEQVGQAAAAGQEGPEAPAEPRDAGAGHGGVRGVQGASVAIPRTARRDTLRGAARAVLAAWDGAPGGEYAGLAGAIEKLRQALAKPATAHAAYGPRPPRAGTKHEAVLALLRRPEGASGPAIAAATGWAPHTVRGFLAGLKKRGVQVRVHERVRQAGPGKEGAKGSYSVYRIAEAG